MRQQEPQRNKTQRRARGNSIGRVSRRIGPAKASDWSIALQILLCIFFGSCLNFAMQVENHDTQGSSVSILLIQFQSAISKYSFSIVLTIHIALVHLVLVGACVYASLFPHTAKALLLIAGALGQPAPFKAFLCSVAHSTKNFMGELSLQLLKLPILKLSSRLATLQFHWPSSGDFCKCQLICTHLSVCNCFSRFIPAFFCAVIHSDVSCLF